MNANASLSYISNVAKGTLCDVRSITKISYSYSPSRAAIVLVHAAILFLPLLVRVDPFITASAIVLWFFSHS